MKITILSDLLRDQLQLVGRVAGKGLPIHEFALVEIRDTNVTMTATDGETRITTHFALSSKEGEDMSFCLRVRQLVEPLREIPNQMLEFEVDPETLEMKGKYTNGFFSFPVISGDDFPEPRALGEDAITIDIPIANFIEALDNTVYATSVDEVRPIMTGVHVDICPEHITFVATNGFLLSYYRHTMLQLDVKDRHRFTLQRKPAQLLQQVLDKEANGNVQLVFYPNYAEFKTESLELQCRLLDGKYPNYESVIPLDNDKLLEADRLQLLAATRRVSIFASRAFSLIGFEFTPNQLTLKANDKDFNTMAEESVPVSFSSDNVNFSFKAEFLIQLLNVLPTDTILMKIGDATRAALVMPSGGEAGVEIVVAMMPLFG